MRNDSILKMWKKCPALLYGLILLLGFLFALLTPWALLPLPLLLHKKHLLAACALFFLPSLLVYHLYTFPPSGATVEGIYAIDTIHQTTRFSPGWSYSGTLKTREGRIHCRTFSKEYFPPTRSYHVSGTLRPLSGKHYALKIASPWEINGSRLSLAHVRFQAQEFVKGYIERRVPQPRAACFLTGMVTGQLDDKVMQKELSALGLSHLMAISGLHFALIALAFHAVLRLVLTPKWVAICLIGILTCYFLFVGDTPSIVRAWIMSLVLLVGQLIERRSSALNSLGVALFLSLLWNPLSALSLSFQLSFLATAGILFFYAPCDALLQKWFPKRPLKEIASKHWAWRHAYIALSLMREGFALTAAVHITLLPLLLAIFHSFPLSSLIYNLFFPFLASIALLFFLLSIVLGPWAHLANGYYCDSILELAASPPVRLQTVDVSAMPPWMLAGLLSGALAIAIGVKVKEGADRLRITDGPLFDHL